MTTLIVRLGVIPVILQSIITLMAGEIIWNDSLSGDIAGSVPTASAYRPLTPSGETDSLPIASGESAPLGCVIAPVDDGPELPSPVPGEPYLRLYDYNTSLASGVEWNISTSEEASYDALVLSFQLRPQAVIADGGDLRLSVGRYSDSDSLTLNSGANRPFLVSFTNNGDVTMWHSDFEQQIKSTFDPVQTQDVTLFINDNDLLALPITTPDGGNESLSPNTLVLFMGDACIGQTSFDDVTPEREYATKPNNLGRISFHTSSTAAGVDFGITSITLRSLHPYFPGLYPQDEYRHVVLAEEAFDVLTADVSTLPSWQQTSGSGTFIVDENGLLFDYTGDAGDVSAQHFFRDELLVEREPTTGEYGPYFYLRFELTLDVLPESGGEDFFFGYNNPSTIENMRGFIWLKRSETGDTAEIGVSAPTTNPVYSPHLLETGTIYTILVRYDLSRNDSWIWVDPDAETEPDAFSADPDDYSYSRVEAVTANFDSADALGRFHVDNLRVATSFRSALAKGPYDTFSGPEIVRGSTAFTATGDSYLATMDFYGNLTGLSQSGVSLLAQGLWNKEDLGEIGDRRNIDRSYVKAQTELLMAHLDASPDALKLFLQNNDDSQDGAYELVLENTSLTAVTLDDGSTFAAPFSSSASLTTTSAILDFGAEQVWLCGIDAINLKSPDHVDASVATVDMPSKSLRQIDFFFGHFNLLDPSEYRVFQRTSLGHGPVLVKGRAPAGSDLVEVRFSGESTFGTSLPEGWQTVAWANESTGLFEQSFTLPAGGWYSAEVRASGDGTALATKTVERFGVGEVFVGSGQSNSTNAGTEAVDQASGMVAAFTGGHWQLGNDPFPGPHDSTQRGSYYSTLGDLLYERLGVPIAFASSGHGGTSIALWQSDVDYRYNSFTYARYNGIYDWTLHRIRQLGADGIRGVLWHQGESDSSHTPGVTRTTENDYYDRLRNLIENIRADAGWNVPWYVAQVSVWPLPSENPEGDENIQAAQARIWSDGVAYQGANSDSIGVEYHQLDGSRVHFRPPGLMRHGTLWSIHVGDQIDRQTGGIYALDTDKDSLPDYWERLWDFPVEVPATNTHSDADGYSDYDEFIAGSNPLDPNDFPAMKSQLAGGQWQLAFTAQPYRKYRLWESSDLIQWSVVEEQVAVEPTPVTHESTVPSGPLFYKLEWSNDLEPATE